MDRVIVDVDESFAASYEARRRHREVRTSGVDILLSCSRIHRQGLGHFFGTLLLPARHSPQPSPILFASGLMVFSLINLAFTRTLVRRTSVALHWVLMLIVLPHSRRYEAFPCGLEQTYLGSLLRRCSSLHPISYFGCSNPQGWHISPGCHGAIHGASTARHSAISLAYTS